MQRKLYVEFFSVVVLTFFFIFSSSGFSFAQNIDHVNSKDSGGIVSSPRVRNSWGIRIGAGHWDLSSNLLPFFNPYLEVPIGNIYVSAELQIVFSDFNTLNPFQTLSYQNVGYGWAGKCRWFYDNTTEKGFFSSAGIQMVVHPDKVSAGFPLSTGYLTDLSGPVEFEGAVTFTPLFYFAHHDGYYIYFTIGVRVPNF